MNDTQSFKDLEIDGISYTVNMLPAAQGLKLATKLLKIIGDPLAELVKVQGDKTKIFEILPMAVKTLTERLDEDEVVVLAKSLCSCVCKVGTSAPLDRTFDIYFRGKYGHLFKVLKEVVMYNFSDFLDVLPLVKTEGQAAQK